MEDVLPGICSWQWFSQRHSYDYYGTLVLEVVASSPLGAP